MAVQERRFRGREDEWTNTGTETMIAYKTGVRVHKRTLALSHIENCALQTQAELGYPEVLLITSIHDSAHSRNPLSRHYTDEAIDIRTKGPLVNSMGTHERKRRFRRRFQELLGACFYAKLEKLGKPHEHLHAQVAKGRVYP